MRCCNLVFLFVTPVVGFIAPSSRKSAHRKEFRPQELNASIQQASLPDGLLKSVAKSGNGVPVKLGDIATVRYSCYLADDPTAPPFSKSNLQKLIVGDGSMIEGWDKALRTMSIGERSVVRIVDPQLAYGDKGVYPLIPSNAVIEMDVEILDSQPATANIDFDSLALVADATPTTAKDIAAAYESRQAARANIVEKEGLEYWIEKFKSFYFYGLFEGETGERPPWFLRPGITFPIAFVIVGAAFYVSFANGGITERGAQVTDELDQIILSSLDTKGVLLAALFCSQFSDALL